MSSVTNSGLPPVAPNTAAASLPDPAANRATACGLSGARSRWAKRRVEPSNPRAVGVNVSVDGPRPAGRPGCRHDGQRGGPAAGTLVDDIQWWPRRPSAGLRARRRSHGRPRVRPSTRTSVIALRPRRRGPRPRARREAGRRGRYGAERPGCRAGRSDLVDKSTGGGRGGGHGRRSSRASVDLPIPASPVTHSLARVVAGLESPIELGQGARCSRNAASAGDLLQAPERAPRAPPLRCDCGRGPFGHRPAPPSGTRAQCAAGGATAWCNPSSLMRGFLDPAR